MDKKGMLVDQFQLLNQTVNKFWIKFEQTD
jgi:hypothetical protein